MVPARIPMRIAVPGVTNPLAGVMVARPAMAPEQKPSTLGLPRVMYSIVGHTKHATDAESVVVTKAFAAMTSAATALPALKPYQPTQSIPVPTEQRTMLCGGIGSLPWPWRGPSTRQSASADQPEVMWTTMPPAKSIALIVAESLARPFIIPPAPHIMWAVGK